jgi:hypothetical protein
MSFLLTLVFLLVSDRESEQSELAALFIDKVIIYLLLLLLVLLVIMWERD